MINLKFICNQIKVLNPNQGNHLALALPEVNKNKLLTERLNLDLTKILTPERKTKIDSKPEIQPEVVLAKKLQIFISEENYYG